MKNTVLQGDSLYWLNKIKKNSVDLIYFDETTNHPEGFFNYYAFIYPRLKGMFNCLRENGSILIHISYRDSYRLKFWLDAIFGIHNFQNQIVLLNSPKDYS
ncbi:MAG: hypothetical protein ACRYGG_11855, partial [Janthinobacterium lividum]